uniref:Uncharacterized protein n=1 Tax=Streptomyces flaveolus TaxID=67297 RepID=D3U9X4_9ACTN|nr:putative protein kinase [Streptomyces flaveolus]
MARPTSRAARGGSQRPPPIRSTLTGRDAGASPGAGDLLVRQYCERSEDSPWGAGEWRNSAQWERGGTRSPTGPASDRVAQRFGLAVGAAVMQAGDSRDGPARSGSARVSRDD